MRRKQPTHFADTSQIVLTLRICSTPHKTSPYDFAAFAIRQGLEHQNWRGLIAVCGNPVKYGKP